MPAVNIAFIGGGSIARSIIGGLRAGGWPADRLFAADPEETARARLNENFGVRCYADNAQCAQQGEVVVLAVKPYRIRAAVESVAAVIRANSPLLISVAAGVRNTDIARWGGGDAVVRAMPNTPSAVGAGMCGLFAAAATTAAQRARADAIFQAVGATVWVAREELLDAITGISGSGPAYFFKIMELFAAAAQRHGLPPADAQTVAVQTAFGSAKLAQARIAAAATLQSDESQSEAQPAPQSLAELRARVATAGGTTEAGLRAMAEYGLDAAIAHGIDAAVARAQALSEN